MCNLGPMILLIVGLSKSETLSSLISCFLWMQGFSWDFTDPFSVLFNSVFSLHCTLDFCTSADPEDYCDTDAVDLRLNTVPSQMLEYGAISVHIFANTGKKIYIYLIGATVQTRLIYILLLCGKEVERPKITLKCTWMWSKWHVSALCFFSWFLAFGPH